MPPISSKIVVARRQSLTATGFDESLFPGRSPAGLSFSLRGNGFIWNGGESTKWQFREGYLEKERENLLLQRQRGFLIRCRLLPGLSQQAASNRGCPLRVQCLLIAKRQRDALLQNSCYLKATSNSMSCCIFPGLDTSTVSSASVGRGHTWTENLASHSAARYTLHHH